MPPIADVIDCSSAKHLFEMIRPKGRLPLGTVEIFRGQGDATFRLVPKALRAYDSPGEKPTIAQVIHREAKLLLLFVEACDRGGIAVPQDGKVFREQLQELTEGGGPAEVDFVWPLAEHYDIWAVAQHHTMPTRLLDWSTNPIVACYFAAESCLTSCLTSTKDKPAPKRLAVWLLRKTSIVELDVEKPGVRFVKVAPANSRNLTAQLGVFTVTPEYVESTGAWVSARPLEAFYDFRATGTVAGGQEARESGAQAALFFPRRDAVLSAARSLASLSR